MSDTQPRVALRIFLLVYLFLVGIAAAVFVVINFPSQTTAEAGGNRLVFPHGSPEKPIIAPFGPVGSTEQGLICLAFLAGIAGSFIHAGQSYSSYLGNRTFKASWTAWYLLRPWIGGVLGLSLFFAVRAGFVTGQDAVNPYAVVALGLLGGWFSKTTSDKLQEVFETLFKTNADRERADKLDGGLPVLERIEPATLAAGQNDITLHGKNFLDGAKLRIGGAELPTQFVSSSQLKASLAALAPRPAAGTSVQVQVLNPDGAERVSTGQQLTFQ